MTLTQKLAAAASVIALMSAAPASADGADALEIGAREEQARLAAHIASNPTDYESTYRYVLLSRDLLDYEAGIGALERVLMFNPDLARARKELGFLYARQGSYELAAQHLRAALADGSLDPVQAAQIEAQLPDIEKLTQANRLTVRLHVGFRSQSNANFFPTNSLFQVGGIGLGSFAPRRGDINTFQMLTAAHDYDFQNAWGAVVETRVTAYATQQMNLPQYSVALFSGSTGPRFYVAPAFYNLSVKPYLTGAVSLLGSNNYLNAGGAGASFRVELSPDTSIDPGAEWRSVWVDQGRSIFGPTAFATLSTLATGDVTTGYVGGTYRYDNDIRLDGRVAYSRARAWNAQQSSNQVDVQAMLRLEVDPPFPIIPRRWTIGPFARFTHLVFDAANPLVNPWVARRDTAWSYGVMLDAPVTANLGFNGHLEFADNNSNLPNFQTRNVAVTFGPTLKF